MSQSSFNHVSDEDLEAADRRLMRAVEELAEAKQSVRDARIEEKAAVEAFDVALTGWRQLHRDYQQQQGG